MPTPTGAKGVVACFSAASMRTERTSAEVMNISMKTPLVLLVPSDKNVLNDALAIDLEQNELERRNVLDGQRTR